MEPKLRKLESLIRGLHSAVIAYSGGVDSTLVASVAFEVLGQRAMAVTASSPIRFASDAAQAQSLARSIGIRHITIETWELDDASFVANSPQRCYHCKRMLIRQLRGIAQSDGLAAVVDGSNYDDLQQDRPGRRAAEELGVVSPLAEIGLTKGDIRAISRCRLLPNWNKPSQSCLATRLPHGTAITVELLQLVASAEQCLTGLGLSQYRVRHHGPIARIELSPEDFRLLADEAMRLRIVDCLRSIGYSHVTLDLAGYQTGEKTL